MVVSLNYCSQNGGNLCRAPYYNRNPNIGPRIDSNLGQSPDGSCMSLRQSWGFAGLLVTWVEGSALKKKL